MVFKSWKRKNKLIHGSLWNQQNSSGIPEFDLFCIIKEILKGLSKVNEGKIKLPSSIFWKGANYQNLLENNLQGL